MQKPNDGDKFGWEAFIDWCKRLNVDAVDQVFRMYWSCWRQAYLKGMSDLLADLEVDGI